MKLLPDVNGPSVCNVDRIAPGRLSNSMIAVL